MAPTNDHYPNLGKNIRALRKTFGESQLDLAFAIGVNHSTTISNYENGTQIPERDNLFKIAKHYRITVYELLYGTFEYTQNLAQLPLCDDTLGISLLSKVFPTICTPQALEDSRFAQAHKMHIQLVDKLKTGNNLESDKIKQCLDLYKDAGRNGLDEATANHLGWLMFLGFITVFLTPRLIESFDVIDTNKITPKDVFNNLLPSFIEPDTEKEFDTNQDRFEFLEECEIDIIVDILLLRKSEKYSDLGDYYLALRHKYSLLKNTLSMEMNNVIGNELLTSFSLMGNEYCVTYLEAMKFKPS